MDHYLKFLAKLEKKIRWKVQAAVDLIVDGNTSGLDIKPLRGSPGLYRCRIGDIRLIFAKGQSGQNFIVDADFRGNIYKN